MFQLKILERKATSKRRNNQDSYFNIHSFSFHLIQ